MQPMLCGLVLLIVACTLLAYLRYHSAGSTQRRQAERSRDEIGAQARRDLLDRSSG